MKLELNNLMHYALYLFCTLHFIRFVSKYVKLPLPTWLSKLLSIKSKAEISAEERAEAAAIKRQENREDKDVKEEALRLCSHIFNVFLKEEPNSLENQRQLLQLIKASFLASSPLMIEYLSPSFIQEKRTRSSSRGRKVATKSQQKEQQQQQQQQHQSSSSPPPPPPPRQQQQQPSVQQDASSSSTSPVWRGRNKNPTPSPASAAAAAPQPNIMQSLMVAIQQRKIRMGQGSESDDNSFNN